jgi:hypothetical protein
MRGTKDLYSKIYSMDNLMLAHKNARKGKGWYREVKYIDSHLEEKLTELQQMLINHTYKTSEYETFMKTEGLKEREIYKLPYFPDRVCQWAILQVIEPYLIKNMTKDTYSAIPQRGIHQVVKQFAGYHDERVVKGEVVKRWIPSILLTDLENTAYCLKIDARKYYPSINHSILKAKYRKLFKDKELIWLLDEIIDSTEGDTGIPIGNYLSQYSGNMYLSSFDHWIKEEIGIKHYYRYMDDIVILHGSKEFLHDLKCKIDTYFWEELRLKIKDNWQVFPSKVRGIDFVGYRFFGEYTLLRKTTCKQFKRRMRSINKKRENNVDPSHTDWCSFNSYKGWLLYCDSYRLTQKYVVPNIEYMENYYQKEVKGHGNIRKCEIYSGGN